MSEMFKLSVVIQTFLLAELVVIGSADFCRDGRLDSGVRTNSNRIFIFFGAYLVELNEAMQLVTAQPAPIRNYFSDMRFDKIDAAFTADGRNNPLRGRTYLIRNRVIKEYNDLRATGAQKNMSEWHTSSYLSNVVLAINQIGDSIVIFFEEASRVGGRMEFFMDSDLNEPYHISAVGILLKENLIDYVSDRGFTLKAVIGLKNNSYLVLYNPNDSTGVGKYCIIQELSKGCENNFRESTKLCEIRAAPTIQTRPPRPTTPTTRTTTSTRPTTRTTRPTRPTTRTTSPTRPTTTTTTRPTTRRTRRTRRTTRPTTESSSRPGPITTGSQTHQPAQSDTFDGTWLMVTIVLIILVLIGIIVFLAVLLGKRQKRGQGVGNRQN